MTSRLSGSCACPRWLCSDVPQNLQTSLTLKPLCSQNRDILATIYNNLRNCSSDLIVQSSAVMQGLRSSLAKWREGAIGLRVFSPSKKAMALAASACLALLPCHVHRFCNYVIMIAVHSRGDIAPSTKKTVYPLY